MYCKLQITFASGAKLANSVAPLLCPRQLKPVQKKVRRRQSRLVAEWPLKILQPLNRLADDSQRGVVNDLNVQGPLYSFPAWGWRGQPGPVWICRDPNPGFGSLQAANGRF